VEPTRQPLPSAKEVERVLSAGQASAEERARAELFYRELSVFMAREATKAFRQSAGPHSMDGAEAVDQFLRHETSLGRLLPGEIGTRGQGFHVDAQVSQCPYQGTCQHNFKALGEVPQCLRAIMLIEAITARVPGRPPLTYDLAPGLVDGKSSSCDISLRPLVLDAPSVAQKTIE
jgi:hypothetical protein